MWSRFLGIYAGFSTLVLASGFFLNSSPGTIMQADQLARISGSACTNYVAHSCKTDSACHQSYPNCNGSCSAACDTEGTHQYCPSAGGFYEWCDNGTEQGCGDVAFQLTCATGPMGNCICTGTAVDFNVDCQRWQHTHGPYCGG
jgi:hypothetical protein